MSMMKMRGPIKVLFAFKISHYPSQPVLVPQLFCKYPSRPEVKKTLPVGPWGQATLPNQINFWKSSKGGSVTFNLKTYIVDFGPLLRFFSGRFLSKQSSCPKMISDVYFRLFYIEI